MGRICCDGPISGDERKASEGRSSSSLVKSSGDGHRGGADILTALSSNNEPEAGVLVNFAGFNIGAFEDCGNSNKSSSNV